MALFRFWYFLLRVKGGTKKRDDITRYMYIDTITSLGEKDGCRLP